MSEDAVDTGTQDVAPDTTDQDAVAAAANNVQNDSGSVCKTLSTETKELFKLFICASQICRVVGNAWIETVFSSFEIETKIISPRQNLE